MENIVEPETVKKEEDEMSPEIKRESVLNSETSKVKEEIVEETSDYPAAEDEPEKSKIKVEENIEIQEITLNTVLSCDICFKEYSCRRSLQDHKQVHKGRTKCQECGKVFGSTGNLNLHMRTVHLKELRFVCDECEFKTNIKENFERHLRTHTGEKPHACPNCGNMFKTSSSLSLHIRTVHLKELRFACGECEYKTNYVSSMAMHKRKHTGKKPNECQHCGEVFDDPTLLSNHMIAVHKFKCCEICGKEFSCQSKLKKHQLMHSKEQHVNKYSNVEEHQGNLKYSCKDCDVVFNSYNGLKGHIKSKHEQVRYSCDQCTFQATTLSYLKKHNETKHEGGRYPCNICEYQATHKSNLTKHTQSQHDGVKYSCNQCDLQTTSQRYLKNHQQSQHNGVRYLCDQCEYQASNKSNLRKHQRSQHEDIKYSCIQCNYQASDMSNLKKHILSKHG